MENSFKYADRDGRVQYFVSSWFVLIFAVPKKLRLREKVRSRAGNTGNNGQFPGLFPFVAVFPFCSVIFIVTSE